METVIFLFAIYLALIVIFSVTYTLWNVMRYSISKISIKSGKKAEIGRSLRFSSFKSFCVLLPLKVVFIGYVAITIHYKLHEWQMLEIYGGFDKLEVRHSGWCHREEDEEIVFLTTDKDEIEDFIDTISFRATIPGGSCMCCGDISFDLYYGDTLAHSFSYHHGKTVRFQNDPHGDYSLSLLSRYRLNKWMRSKGVTPSHLLEN